MKVYWRLRSMKWQMYTRNFVTLKDAEEFIVQERKNHTVEWEYKVVQ